ncbi:MAG: FtsX-like permease family protein, partial [Clostridia bacterium]|nr:FtsX-like permease family protein [Clostridia bacterium]
FGGALKTVPSSISLYAKDFASKDAIVAFIDEYNEDAGEEAEIAYTDYIGLMMSSITTIIDVISYVLIAFVSISLVVSSIMIGIITYISVLERTKEIGILRAIGASKRNISSVFNAETLIVGFASGAIGIIVTVLLCFPINWIIRALSGIPNIGAQLPLAGAIILILISMALTAVAGLIPSRIAAKKDPVVALRSE